MNCEVCLSEKSSPSESPLLLRTFGETPEQIVRKLRGMNFRLVESPSGVDLYFKDEDELKRATEILGEAVYSRGEPMEKVVGKALESRGYTLSCAESCTGGLISARVVNIPGSSRYFAGGLVVYSNELKMKLLGVSEKTLERFGAVSEETCSEMLRGLRRKIGTDCGIAVTGIAGPGGSGKKPEGLTYIGVYVRERETIEERILEGSRNEKRFLSSQIALNMLRIMLYKEVA
jgi:nicotinamide-nucleotide amidase